MDADQLRAQFAEFVNSLLDMGYLDNRFRALYITNGLPTALELVTQSITLFSINLESVMGSIKFKLDHSLDFPILATNTADIHFNATQIGAARVTALNEHLRACSDLHDRNGCYWYLEMLDVEFKAVMSALDDIVQLHMTIEKLGASIPLDW